MAPGSAEGGPSSRSDLSDAFELRPTSAAPRATDARVIECKGRRFDATLTMDEAQRRRGTMKIVRHAEADASDPPNASFSIAYTGDTGVDDYMGYEGFDRQNNGYEFALKKSDMEKTSGSIAEVGVGFTRDLASYAVHMPLSCTIRRP